MSPEFLAKMLIVIIMAATCIGLLGVWFPKFWEQDIAQKLFFTFIVLAIGVGIAAMVLKFLPPGVNDGSTTISRESDE